MKLMSENKKFVRGYKEPSNMERLVIGNTVLDFSDLSVKGAESNIVLPYEEFKILSAMLFQHDRVFTRYQLGDTMWKYCMEMYPDRPAQQVLHNCMKNLMNKFKGYHDFEIVIVETLGYKAVTRNSNITT